MSESGDCTRIATGIQGCEGPLVTRDGRIFVVESPKGLVLEVTDGGSLNTAAQTGGIPAGLQLHADGTIWIADMKLGILSLSPDGDLRRVVTAFDGAPIRGCNDLYFDSLGNLYFTAPAGSSLESRCGELFCLLRDGTLLRLDSGFAFCNGIAVSGDDRTLIVAETFTKRLYAYDIERPGTLSGKRVFATLPGDHFGGPDGIDFDANGHLISTNWGGGHLEVLSPDGALIGRVTLPFAKPSNIQFKGPDSHSLLITEHTTQGLWICEWPCAGQRQFGWS